MESLTFEAFLLGMAMIIAADMIDVNVHVNVTDKPIVNQCADSTENVPHP